MYQQYAHPEHGGAMPSIEQGLRRTERERAEGGGKAADAKRQEHHRPDAVVGAHRGRGLPSAGRESALQHSSYKTGLGRSQQVKARAVYSVMSIIDES